MVNRAKNPLPAYTLPILGGKLYIVSAPDLIMSVQRNSKTLSFDSLVVNATPRVCNLSPESAGPLNANVDGSEGDWGLTREFHVALHAALAPGESLNKLSRRMIECVGSSLEKLAADGKGSRIGLLEWVRHEVTLASTESIYGPQNPLADPEVARAFWDIEGNMNMLLVGVLPKLIARKGWYGREKVAAAILKFYQTGGMENTSALTRARFDACRNNGVSLSDTAQLEAASVLAIASNTTPSTFWLMFYVFSNPQLLQDLREEITPIIATTDDENGAPIRSLDIALLKTKCPLLVSTFQETLRHRAFGATTRLVLEDTLLNDRYLLKKGGVLQMPSYSIHTDPKIWGPTVNDFDPRRFLKKQQPGSFRGFGGGSTLCPGRHFAMAEIFSVVAMMLLRFDVSPVSGKWVMPSQDESNITASIVPPSTDIAVDVRPRKGYETGRWEFELSESKERFNIATQ